MLIILISAGGYEWWTLKQIETTLPLEELQSQRQFSSLIQVLGRLDRSLSAMAQEPTPERKDRLYLAIDINHTVIQSMQGQSETPLPKTLEIATNQLLEILNKLEGQLIQPQPHSSETYQLLLLQVESIGIQIRDSYLHSNKLIVGNLLQQISQIETLRLSSLALLALVFLAMIGMMLLIITQRHTIRLLEDTRFSLRETETSLSAAQKIARLGSWEWRLVENTIEWSDSCQQICGMDPENTFPTREKYLEIVHPEDRERVSQTISKAIETQVPFGVDYRIVLADGTQKSVMERGVFFSDKKHGKVLRGTLQDITERKKIEEELRDSKDKAEAANRSKSAFLANMSHELRTPLNSIIGYSELVMEDMENEENAETLQDLQRIHQSGTHLLGLINEVLDLAKVESGKMELEATDFSVSDLMEEVVAITQPMADTNNNKLLVKLPNQPIQCHSDVTKIKQICLNLLSNAAKFTENGEVRLEIHTLEKQSVQWLSFSVQDTGIGISEENLTKLFHDFGQIDTGLVKKYAGTGLGLSISKKYSEMLGGSLAVQSTKGIGTTFTLQIPCVLP